MSPYVIRASQLGLMLSSVSVSIGKDLHDQNSHWANSPSSTSQPAGLLPAGHFSPLNTLLSIYRGSVKWDANSNNGNIMSTPLYGK